jgi:hypothetical protein
MWGLCNWMEGKRLWVQSQMVYRVAEDAEDEKTGR